MSRRDKEPSGVPPVPVSKENLEEVVRVVKTGLHHQHVISDSTRESLGMWVTEMEDDIDIEEGRDPAARKPPPFTEPEVDQFQAEGFHLQSGPTPEPFELHPEVSGSMEAEAARLQAQVPNRGV